MHIFYIWRKTYIKKSYMNVPIISIYWLHGIFSINDISYHMPTQPPWWPVISRHMPCHANPNQPLRPSIKAALGKLCLQGDFSGMSHLRPFWWRIVTWADKKSFYTKNYPKKGMGFGEIVWSGIFRNKTKGGRTFFADHLRTPLENLTWKIKDHPLEKDNHLPTVHFLGFQPLVDSRV